MQLCVQQQLQGSPQQRPVLQTEQPCLLHWECEIPIQMLPYSALLMLPITLLFPWMYSCVVSPPISRTLTNKLKQQRARKKHLMPLSSKTYNLQTLRPYGAGPAKVAMQGAGQRAVPYSPGKVTPMGTPDPTAGPVVSGRRGSAAVWQQQTPLTWDETPVGPAPQG